MLVTAAGTIQPARVFVIGAGVAGLQAIATARRLGAIVEAYDTRAGGREQVESLGARFVDARPRHRRCAGRRRLREGADRGVLPAAAPRARQAPRAERRRDHHRAGARPARADPDRRGRGARHEARLGDRRSRGGAGRQLRALRSERPTHAHGVQIVPGRNLASDSRAREPAVRAQPPHLAEAPRAQGRAGARSRGRDHARLPADPPGDHQRPREGAAPERFKSRRLDRRSAQRPRRLARIGGRDGSACRRCWSWRLPASARPESPVPGRSSRARTSFVFPLPTGGSGGDHALGRERAVKLTHSGDQRHVELHVWSSFPEAVGSR